MYEKTYNKANLILNKDNIGSLYNIRISYVNYNFKAETLNCLLCDIDNCYAYFLADGVKTAFDLYDKDAVLYAKKIF